MGSFEIGTYLRFGILGAATLEKDRDEQNRHH